MPNEIKRQVEEFFRNRDPEVVVESFELHREKEGYRLVISKNSTTNSYHISGFDTVQDRIENVLQDIYDNLILDIRRSSE